MAVDTLAKRASALNAFRLGIGLPVPDGTVGDGDRQHLAGFYRAILAEAPPEGGPLRNVIHARLGLDSAVHLRPGLNNTIHPRNDLITTIDIIVEQF